LGPQGQMPAVWLEPVTAEVDRSPKGFPVVVRSVAMVPYRRWIAAGSLGGDVSLRLDQRRRVRTGRPVRPAELIDVVLPAAHGTDVLRSRRLRKRPVSAAHTRVSDVHGR